MNACALVLEILSVGRTAVEYNSGFHLVTDSHHILPDTLWQAIISGILA